MDNQTAPRSFAEMMAELGAARTSAAPRSFGEMMQDAGIDPSRMVVPRQDPPDADQRLSLMTANAVGMAGRYAADVSAGRPSDVNPMAVASTIVERGAAGIVGEQGGAFVGGLVDEASKLATFVGRGASDLYRWSTGRDLQEDAASTMDAVGIPASARPFVSAMVPAINVMGMSRRAIDQSPFESRGTLLQDVSPEVREAAMGRAGLARDLGSGIAQVAMAVGSAMVPGGQGVAAAKATSLVGKLLAPAKAMLGNWGGRSFLAYMGSEAAMRQSAEYRQHVRDWNDGADRYNDAVERLGIPLGRIDREDYSRAMDVGTSLAAGVVTATSELIGTSMTIAATRAIGRRLLGKGDRLVRESLGGLLKRGLAGGAKTGGLEGLEEAWEGYGHALIRGIYSPYEEGRFLRTLDPKDLVRTLRQHAPDMLYEAGIAALITAPLGIGGGIATGRRRSRTFEAFAQARLSADMRNDPTSVVDLLAARVLAGDVRDPDMIAAAADHVRRDVPRVGTADEQTIADPAFADEIVAKHPLLAMRLAEADSLSRRDVEWLTGGQATSATARATLLANLQDRARTMAGDSARSFLRNARTELEQLLDAREQLIRRTDVASMAQRVQVESRIQTIDRISRAIHEAVRSGEIVDDKVFSEISELRVRMRASEDPMGPPPADPLAIDQGTHPQSLRQLAAQGDAEAMMRLAEMHEGGVGADLSASKARYWLNMALAQSDDVQAMEYLGRYWEGIARDPSDPSPSAIRGSKSARAKAIRYYRRAYEMGSETAGPRLAELEAMGMPTPTVPRPGRVDAAEAQQAARAAYRPGPYVPVKAKPEVPAADPEVARERLRALWARQASPSQPPDSARSATMPQEQSAPNQGVAAPAMEPDAVEGIQQPKGQSTPPQSADRVPEEASPEPAAGSAPQPTIAEPSADEQRVTEQVRARGNGDEEVRFVAADTPVRQRVAKALSRLGRRVQYVSVRNQGDSVIRGFILDDPNVVYVVAADRSEGQEPDWFVEDAYLQAALHENMHGVLREDPAVADRVQQVVTDRLARHWRARYWMDARDEREEIQVLTATQGIVRSSGARDLLMGEGMVAATASRLRQVFSRLFGFMPRAKRQAILVSILKEQLARGAKVAEAAPAQAQPAAQPVAQPQPVAAAGPVAQPQPVAPPAEEPQTAVSLEAAIRRGDAVRAFVEDGGSPVVRTYGSDARFVERRGGIYAIVGKSMERLTDPRVVPAGPPPVGKARTKRDAKPSPPPQPVAAAEPVATRTSKPKRAAKPADDSTASVDPANEPVASEIPKPTKRRARSSRTAVPAAKGMAQVAAERLGVPDGHAEVVEDPSSPGSRKLVDLGVPGVKARIWARDPKDRKKILEGLKTKYRRGSGLPPSPVGSQPPSGKPIKQVDDAGLLKLIESRSGIINAAGLVEGRRLMVGGDPDRGSRDIMTLSSLPQVAHVIEGDWGPDGVRSIKSGVLGEASAARMPSIGTIDVKDKMVGMFDLEPQIGSLARSMAMTSSSSVEGAATTISRNRDGGIGYTTLLVRKNGPSREVVGIGQSGVIRGGSPVATVESRMLLDAMRMHTAYGSWKVRLGVAGDRLVLRSESKGRGTMVSVLVTSSRAEGEVSLEDEIRAQGVSFMREISDSSLPDQAKSAIKRGHLMFMRAWHGGPKGIERFDPDRIRRIAYGWGLYATEDKATAMGYARQDGVAYRIDYDDASMIDLDADVSDQPQSVRDAFVQVADALGLRPEILTEYAIDDNYRSSSGNILNQRASDALKAFKLQVMINSRFGDSRPISEREISAARAVSMMLLGKGIKGGRYADYRAKSMATQSPTNIASYVFYDPEAVQIIGQEEMPGNFGAWRKALDTAADSADRGVSFMRERNSPKARQRIAELVGSIDLFDDRGFGTLSHPTDKEDVDAEGIIADLLKYSAKVPRKYLKGAEEFEYLAAAIHHVLIKKSADSTDYERAAAVMSRALDEGIADYDQIVVAARRMGFEGTDKTVPFDIVSEEDVDPLRLNELMDDPDGFGDDVRFMRERTDVQLAADHRAAFERGDESAAREIVREYGRRKGYDEVVWRGDKRMDWPFSYPRSQRGYDGVFTSPSAFVAGNYAGASSYLGSYEYTNRRISLIESVRSFLVGGVKLDLKLRDDNANAWLKRWASSTNLFPPTANVEGILDSGNLYDYEGDGSELRLRSMISAAKKDGYDLLVIPDNQDLPGDMVGRENLHVSIVVLNEGRMKSADPFTYDENGDLIPLDKRFDESTDDIRFMRERLPSASGFRGMASRIMGGVASDSFMTTFVNEYAVVERMIAERRVDGGLSEGDDADVFLKLAAGYQAESLRQLELEVRRVDALVDGIAARTGLTALQVMDKIQLYNLALHVPDANRKLREKYGEEIDAAADRISAGSPSMAPEQVRVAAIEEVLSRRIAARDPEADGDVVDATRIAEELVLAATRLGMSTEEAVRTASELRDEFARRGGTWLEVAARVRGMARGTLDMMARSGLITDEAHQQLRADYPNYVPVIRSVLAEDVQDEDPRSPTRRLLRSLRGGAGTAGPDMTDDEVAQFRRSFHAAQWMMIRRDRMRIARKASLQKGHGALVRLAAADRATLRGDQVVEILSKADEQRLTPPGLAAAVSGDARTPPSVLRVRMDSDADLTPAGVMEDLQAMQGHGLTAAQLVEVRAGTAPHVPLTGKAKEEAIAALSRQKRTVRRGEVVHLRILHPDLRRALLQPRKGLLGDAETAQRWYSQALGVLRFNYITSSVGFLLGEMQRSPQQAAIMAATLAEEHMLDPEQARTFLDGVGKRYSRFYPFIALKGAWHAMPFRSRWRAVRSVLKGEVQSTPYGRMVEQAFRDGVLQGTLYQSRSLEEDVALLKRQIRELQSGAAPRKGGGFIDRAKVIPRSLDMLTTGMDMVNRLVLYESALDAGISRQKAAVMARDATVDFSRKGTAGGKLSQVYLFFAPRMQGIHQLVRAFNAGQGSRAATRIATVAVTRPMRILGQLFLWSLLLKLVSEMFVEDDDDPQSQPSRFAAMQNLIYPIYRQEDGRWIYLQARNPYGFGAVAKVANRIGEMLMGDEAVGTTLMLAAGDVAAEMLPISPTDYSPGGIAQSLAPTIVAPLADAFVFERDWKGSPVAPFGPEFGAGTPLRSRDYFSDTNAAFVVAANLLSEVTGAVARIGGSTDSRGIEVSPNQISYVLSRYMPGLVNDAAKAVGSISGAAYGDPPDVRELPVVSTFAGRTGGPTSVPGQWRDLTGIAANIREDIKERGPEWSLEVHGDRARFVTGDFYKAIERDVKKLQQARNQAVERGDRARARMIDDRMNELRIRALRAWSRLTSRGGLQIDQRVREATR